MMLFLTSPPIKRYLENHEPHIYRWGNWSSKTAELCARTQAMWRRGEADRRIYRDSLMWTATTGDSNDTDTYSSVTTSSGVQYRTATLQYNTHCYTDDSMGFYTFACNSGSIRPPGGMTRSLGWSFKGKASHFKSTFLLFKIKYWGSSY